MSALGVNVTKATSSNSFLNNPSTLQSEKESKNGERAFFRDYPQVLHLAVNRQMSHIYGFLESLINFRSED